MNILDLLKQQHEEAKELLSQIVEQEDRRQSRPLVSKVAKALRLHMAIEETLLYPAASRAFRGDKEDEVLVLESYEEHAVASRTLEVLEKTTGSDKRFVARAKVLKELVENHVKEEENDMFPDLESKLGRETLEKLGTQVERRMSEFERQAAQGGATRTRSTRSVAARSGRAASTRGGRGSRATSRRKAGARSRSTRANSR